MFINKRSCLNSQVTFIYVIRIRICIMYEWKMSKTCRTAVKLIFEFPSVYIGTRIIYIYYYIYTAHSVNNKYRTVESCLGIRIEDNVRLSTCTSLAAAIIVNYIVLKNKYVCIQMYIISHCSL